MPEKKNIESYIRQIDHAISPQAHTAMYLMHKYWARKPHNVVGEYIEHYSKRGEIVLDPFLGSGVTAIEALKRGRKAIAIDLNPLSTFLTRMTVKPVDLTAFKNTYQQLSDSVKAEVEKLYTTTCPKCGKPSLEAYTIWSDIVECGECHERVLISKAKTKEKIVKKDGTEKKVQVLICSLGHELNENAVVGEEPVEMGVTCDTCIKKLGKRVRFIKKTLEGDNDSDKLRLKEINQRPVPYWYPKDARFYYSDGTPFKKKENSASVADLFEKRSLIAHSTVLHQIETIEDKDMQDLMKLVFSSNLHNVSKLNVVHHLRLNKGTHPSRGWVMHSYWIPHLRIELPFWFYFNERYQRILRGKTESNKLISTYKEAKTFDDLKKDANIFICNQSSLILDSAPAKIPLDSIQYIFTDPPYGGSIQYMELSTIYTAWLKGEKNDPRFDMPYDKEVTMNDNQHKSFEYYHKMLKASFDQLYNVLQSGRWLTVTFHNTDIKIYNSIIKAGMLSGFDLEKVIYQAPAVVSPKALLQPYGSAVGDYYIRFRKPLSKEKLLTESEIDKERYARIIVNTVKHLIAVRREPVTYSTIINSYPTIFEQLKKNGYPFSAPEGIDEVLKNHLGKEFELIKVLDDKGKVIGKKWWVKEKLFLERASLSERVEDTVLGMLNRRVLVSYDDILEELFTTFQNSLTPDTQSIKDVLQEYAEKSTDGKWQLQAKVRARMSQHVNMIRMLVDLGKKLDFDVYADHLPELRGKTLNLPLSKEKNDRIKEIDVLWMKDNEIIYEFEVENSTGISDAIIRGSNIPSTVVKRFIVIPEERKRLLMMKTAEPIIHENIEQYKWKFIFYNAFIAFFEDNITKRKVDLSEIDKLADASFQVKHEQQTLIQFPNEKTPST